MTDIALSRFADEVSRIMPAISREFLKQQTGEFYKTKITWPQFVLLDILQKRTQTSMSDLAHLMGVTTAAMTGIVDRLVRDGYVERGSEDGDRRIIKVSLTSKGDKTVNDLIEHRRHVVMKMFGTISQEEREAYLRILKHILEHLNE